MKKVEEFKVNTLQDFQELVDKKDMGVKKAVVNAILNNLKSRRKNIHIISVNCLKENSIFDITLQKEHFVDTLNENIKYFEEAEMYEECSKMLKAIETLNKGR
ncbi:MAG: hypothetical protein ACO25L_05890 [Candidatus Nanopelagicales bacterium]|jgi:hypothetical protein